MRSILIEFHPWDGIGTNRTPVIKAFTLGFFSIVVADFSLMALMADLLEQRAA